MNSLFEAARLTLEGSRALAAARKAHDAGLPLGEVLKAWASETHTDVDDEFLAELEAEIRIACDYAERLAVLGVRASVRVEAWIPVVVEFLRDAADRSAMAEEPTANALRGIASALTRGAERLRAVVGR